MATHSNILVWRIPQRSLVDYGPWGCIKLDRTEWLTLWIHLKSKRNVKSCFFFCLSVTLQSSPCRDFLLQNSYPILSPLVFISIIFISQSSQPYADSWSFGSMQFSVNIERGIADHFRLKTKSLKSSYLSRTSSLLG